MEAGNAEGGLTLIELGVVLLLMALLASFAVPRLYMITEINLRTSTRRLAETLQLISTMATNTSRPYVVRYDLDKGECCYTAARFDPAAGTWTAAFTDRSVETRESDVLAKTKCLRLKEGVFFKAIEPVAGDGQKQEHGRLTQWISPRGVTDPLLIRLGDKKDRVYTLVVSPYGGRVEIRHGAWTYEDYLEDLLE